MMCGASLPLRNTFAYPLAPDDTMVHGPTERTAAHFSKKKGGGTCQKSHYEACEDNISKLVTLLVLLSFARRAVPPSLFGTRFRSTSLGFDTMVHGPMERTAAHFSERNK